MTCSPGVMLVLVSRAVRLRSDGTYLAVVDALVGVLEVDKLGYVAGQ